MKSGLLQPLLKGRTTLSFIHSNLVTRKTDINLSLALKRLNRLLQFFLLNFRIYIAICLLSCANLTSFGQPKPSELSIGEVVPDVPIEYLSNNKIVPKTLKQFKSKLTIIDFWATWCAPCVSAFPKLDSLKQEFKGDLEIVSVTAESKTVTQSFLAKLNKYMQVPVSTGVNDTILNFFFPHLYLPHYVWLDQDLKVFAVTESNEVTSENIIKFLESKPMNVRQKIDAENYIISGTVGNYSLFAPSILITHNDSMKLDNVPPKEVMFQSVLTKYNPGLISGGSFGSDGTSISLNNMTIRNLYRTALLGNKLESFNSNLLIIEVKDSILYDKIAGKRRSSSAELRDWLAINGYCYLIRVAPELAKKKEHIMLNELNQNFGALLGIEGKIEKRETKYLSLQRSNNDSAFYSKSLPSVSKKDKFSLIIKNKPMQNLVGELTMPLQRFPVIIDETDFKGKIDIELNCPLSDLNAVNKELSKFGLRLVEKEKLLDVGVITMTKG
jgi:thiol-disulfide isomerase/thioredoxin